MYVEYYYSIKCEFLKKNWKYLGTGAGWIRRGFGVWVWVWDRARVQMNTKCSGKFLKSLRVQSPSTGGYRV